MLTDTKLRSLKAKDKVFRIADSNGPTIEVRPAGAKFWMSVNRPEAAPDPCLRNI